MQKVPTKYNIPKYVKKTIFNSLSKNTRVRQHTSSSFSGRPFKPPFFNCRSQSHHPSKSASTKCNELTIARAPTQQKTIQ